MSALQSKAKPYIEPLVSGRDNMISLEGAEVIAQWLTMFLYVLEFADETSITATAEDRLEFARTQKPRDGLKIFSGILTDDVSDYYFWHSGALVDVGGMGKEFKWVSIDTVPIGRWAIHAFTVPFFNVFQLNSLATAMESAYSAGQIWPKNDQYPIELPETTGSRMNDAVYFLRGNILDAW